MRRHIPSVSETYAKIRREEGRLVVIMKKEALDLVENFALTAGKYEQNWSSQRGIKKKSKEKEKRWCDLCNKLGHIQEKC